MKQKVISALCAIILLLSGFNVKLTASAQDMLVIDNSDTRVSYNGNWTEDSSGNGFYGTNFVKSANGDVKISVTVETDGYYKLYARWPSEQQVSQEMNISVINAKEEEYTVIRDQTINGGYWVFIGTYFFTKQGKQSVKINAADGRELIFDALRLVQSVQTSQKSKGSWFANSSNTTNVNTVAKDNTNRSYITNVFSLRKSYSDLLKLTTIASVKEEKTETKMKSLSKPGDEVIYDINSPGSSSSGGKWKKETDQNSYSGTYLVDGDISADFMQFVKWKPQILKDGKYEIYMRWPEGENRPINAKFRIKNADFVIGSAIIDQSKNANKWNRIGEYNLYKSDPYAVTIWANSSGITAADAIKVKFVTDDIPPKVNNTISYERKNYTAEKQDQYNIVLDDDDKFFFTKNGEIYNINGVCYSNTAMYMEQSMKYFVEAGGNMMRTYGTEVLDQGFLDYAYEHGVGVMAGISIPKDATYYTDEEKYRNYVESQKRAIDEFKNHPALVMWSVNNESEAADTDGEIYAMIEEISAYIKQVDPYHPISTSFAGCNVEKQKKLKTLSPSVEILGMNAYSAIKNAYSSSVESGWNAPIMVTEYGPNGTWGNECTRTSWNAVIEQNNDEKAILSRERHLEYIMSNNKGIGGFAFCLPYAVGGEGTLSWYGFVFGGMKTPIMDEMQYAWTGTYPKNAAPRIKSFTLNSKNAEDSIIVNPDDALELQINATDRDNDELTYHFDIYEEVQSALTGKLPMCVASADNPKNSSVVKTTAPIVPGYYRIYGYVTDGHNNVDVNNIPIYVKESSVLKTDTNEVENLIKSAAASYAKSGSVSAKVKVHADDNINGMPYTGDGTADIEADAELIHIKSDVAYKSSGNMLSEVYIGKEESWQSDAQTNPVKSEGWYDIVQAFKSITEDKNLINQFSLDKISDSAYYILSADVFLPQFYPFALSGINSVRFMEDVDKPDAYSLVIYISKSTGKIEKAIATAGYMRSEENAEYRKLQYTYEYDADDSITISVPDKWRG